MPSVILLRFLSITPISPTMSTLPVPVSFSSGCILRFACEFMSQVTCFAEAGGQHVSGMAKAVELLGIRTCLTQSTMDSGYGLPPDWSTHSMDYCIESHRSLYGKHHNTANGRIRIWFGLRQIMNASDILIETRDIAKELKTGIHMVGSQRRRLNKITYERERSTIPPDFDHIYAHFH